MQDTKHSVRRAFAVCGVAGALALSLTACGARTAPLLPVDTVDAGDAGPAPNACPGAPPVPTPIVSAGSYADFESISALIVVGGYLYYSVRDSSNNPLALFRVATTGGAPERLLDGVSGCASSPLGFGSLVSDGRHVFTRDEVVVGCTGHAVHVTAYDIASGNVSTLPNPMTSVPRYATRVRATPAGALWLSDDQDLTNALLARWDGSSTSVVATIPEPGVNFVVAAGKAFVQTYHHLLAVPLQAGPITTIGPAGTTHFALFGQNSSAIYYTPDDARLVRRDLATGATQTISSDPTLALRSGDVWVDDDWVYVQRRIPPIHESLVRMPATGGGVEVVEPEDGRSIGPITSDACNVYWVEGPDYTNQRPTAIFARRR